MKLTNKLQERRSHGGFDIDPGQIVDVTNDESADWLIRHGCSAVDATPAPETGDTDRTIPRRAKRRSRRD